MKKLKVNFGEGGIQGWLVRHVEKFVLVLFAGVMVWFVISGSRLEGIKSGQSPDVLKSDAQAAVTSVTTPRWDQVKIQPERQVAANVEGTVKNNSEFKANKDKYQLLNAWNEPMIAKLKRRSDPQILAPFNLKVVSIYGPFAYYPDATDVDPLDQIIAEVEDPKDPKKKKPAPKKPAPKKPAAPGMAGMVGGMPGMPGDKGKKGKASDKGGGMPGMPGMAGMPGMPGMDGEDGAAGMPGMPGMPGMGGMGGPAGKFAESQIIGWRPPTSSTIRIAAANVVMAIVPYEKQNEEFAAQLENSLDYDPSRDKPHYLYFAVQRIDVTADPTADPATVAEDVWKAGTLNVAASLESMKTWAGMPNDIMDPSYLLPLYPRQSPEHPPSTGITQPLPAFVQRDLYNAMTHPDIPLASAAVAAPDAPAAHRPKPGETETPDEIPGGATGIPGGGGAGMAGGAGMPGMAGGMPGMAGGMPGMAGAGMPGAGGGRMPGMPAAGGAGGMPSMAGGMPGVAGGGMAGGMPGMAGGGMPGMAGMMPGMGGGMGTDALVKYKLLRFVDQTVQKGHKYRYRVKVFVEDPNYPSATYATPSLAGLDDKAHERVRALEVKDEKSGGKTKSFYRDSKYSSASEVVTLPPAEWFYAGKVEPESFQVLPQSVKKYTNFKTQAATSLVVAQDDKKGVDVPAKSEFYKGSAINFSLPEVDVIHPALGEKRTIEKYSFQTNAVIADMRGGDEIPVITGEHSTNMKAPGEILVVDAAGNMHVRDEVDDIEYFHRFLGPDKEPEGKTKPGEPPAGAGFDGMMGMPGIPGAGGGAMPGMPAPGGGKGPKR